MPAHHRTLDRRALLDHVERQVFGGEPDPDADACGRDGIGIELEWLTGLAGFARLGQAEADAIRRRLGALPGQSRLTVEPGGQLEISTPPFRSIVAACDAAATDLFHLDRACEAIGVDLVGLGADPVRPPQRVVHSPRYDAMECFFDHTGTSGRTMMCNTAAIQVNIGLGPDTRVARRWELANAFGPTLIAAFANSPFAGGGPSGWKSSRLQAWWALDPSRSGPVPRHGDPVVDWVDYALAARVMCVRTSEEEFHPIIEQFPFERWLSDGHELGWPTLDDFVYHLTTLFPPVRPKGWFELRMIDALPTPFWHVAAAVVFALLIDDDATREALTAVAATTDMWVDAAQLGLGHPRLQQAATRCFEIAIDALGRIDGGEATVDIVAAYHDRWVVRGRCPADDRHDAWRRDGTVLPVRESPVPYAFAGTALPRP